MLNVERVRADFPILSRKVNGKPLLSPEQSLATAREMLSAPAQWKPTLMIGPPCG